MLALPWVVAVWHDHAHACGKARPTAWQSNVCGSCGVCCACVRARACCKPRPHWLNERTILVVRAVQSAGDGVNFFLLYVLGPGGGGPVRPRGSEQGPLLGAGEVVTPPYIVRCTDSAVAVQPWRVNVHTHPPDGSHGRVLHTLLCRISCVNRVHVNRIQHLYLIVAPGHL